MKCSGLSTSRELTQDFVRQHYIHPSSENGTNQPENQRTEPEGFLENTDPSPIDFWGRTTERHCQVLKLIYLEVVHWKPKFILQPKNNKGHLFIDTMNILFEQVAEKNPMMKQLYMN